MTIIAIDALAADRAKALSSLAECPEITKVTDMGEIHDSDYFRIVIETSWSIEEFDYWLEGDGLRFYSITTFNLNDGGPTEVMMNV